MGSPVQSSSMPVMLAIDIDAVSSTTLHTREDYYYEPIDTASDVYDTEIDNISDLNPNDPVAIREFIAKIGPSETPSPVEVDAGEEYDADEENSQPSVESMDVEGNHYVDLTTIFEDEEDHECETEQLELMRFMAGDWTLEPKADSGTEHPALAQHVEFPELSSNASYDSNFSGRSRWTWRTFSADWEPSDGRTSNVTGSEDHSFVCDAEEYFDFFAGARHYPEAAQFFAVEFSTGFFTNPFTTSSSTDSARLESPPSPLARTNDYGLVENWNFQPEGNDQRSPVSPLSNYSQPEDDRQPVSPISPCCRQHDRHESGAFSPEISDTPELTHNRFHSLSSGSASSSSGVLFSASGLIAQLNELVFDNAAYEFFSPIDVNALVSDQASSAYKFQNHDILQAYLNIDREWPFKNWLPHGPRRSCHCQWCIEYWVPDEEEEINRPHDFETRCSCPVCESFKFQEGATEMQLAEEEQKIRERDLERTRERKRKRQQSESQHWQMHAFDEREARHQLRREIRRVNVALEAGQAEMEAVSESISANEERRFAELQDFQVQQANEADETEARDWNGKKRKHCLGLYDWVRRRLRESDTD